MGYYIGMSESEAELSDRFSMAADVSSVTYKDGIVICTDGYCKEYDDVIKAIKEELEENGII